MSEFRGPHDLRAGDRVLVVDDEKYEGSMRAGEIRTVESVEGDFASLVGGVLWRFRCKRFLRIAEPGEVVPDGAVLRSIGCAMVGDSSLDVTFPSATLEFFCVVISVPSAESERERKLRELGEQIERLQAKYDDLAGVGE